MVVAIIMITTLRDGHYTNYATLLLLRSLSCGREIPTSPRNRSPVIDPNLCHCYQFLGNDDFCLFTWIFQNSLFHCAVMTSNARLLAENSNALQRSPPRLPTLPLPSSGNSLFPVRNRRHSRR